MSGPQSYLLGLVGHPVSHSLSPPMHRAALEHVGVSGAYELIDLKPEVLESGVADLRSRGFAGFNVTIPHKQALLSLCDRLTPEAGKTRAVNTVKIEDGALLVGHNTDLAGFAITLADALPGSLRRKAACVVGSGGAARAAVWSLISDGWPRIAIIARNQDRAAKLVDEVRTVAGQLDPSPELPRFELADTTATGLSTIPDLLVNCTAIGLSGEPVPDWLIDVLRIVDPEGVIFDMVYSQNGQPTALVREASRLRYICLDGTDMLVNQAQLAFEFWTGRHVPAKIMRQALEKERTAR